MSNESINLVLLVEDNLGDARLLREAFNEQGPHNTELMHVESMDQAEKHLAQRAFDLILLDLGLPDAQGLEVVRRAHAAAPHVPLVVLTGLDDESLAVQALQEGAQDYLLKGHLESRGLLRALRYAVERKAMQQVLVVEKEELRATQIQLLQADKMASIGQLAAGVAHEINNPVGYVDSNLASLERYLNDLFGVIGAYENAELFVSDPAARLRIEQVKQTADLAFIRQDIFALMTESREGLTRVKRIVHDLRDFSHADAEDDWRWVDLHRGLDSTLNIVNHAIKYKAEVVKLYGQLPEVECLPSQLNQVFMNLLINAGHAIEDKGTITLKSGSGSGEVWIEISDTGGGIAPQHLKRIFEPFFTTKPVGKGTGLGLSLSYGIVQKHRGRIEVQSELGKGTVVRVTLPVRHIAMQVQPEELSLTG